MASIIKVGNKWRAQVRRRGYAVYTRSFATKTLAAAWAAGIEADIARGLVPSAQHVAGKRYTVSDAIRDYRALRRARPILDTSTEHYTLQHLAAALAMPTWPTCVSMTWWAMRSAAVTWEPGPIP
jgi:hypothetical protein